MQQARLGATFNTFCVCDHGFVLHHEYGLLTFSNQNKLWYMLQGGFDHEKSFFHTPKASKAQL